MFILLTYIFSVFHLAVLSSYFYLFAVDLAFLLIYVDQGQGYLNKEQCVSLLDELNKYR